MSTLEFDECFSFSPIRTLEFDECFSFLPMRTHEFDECFSFWPLWPLKFDECLSFWSSWPLDFIECFSIWPILSFEFDEWWMTSVGIPKLRTKVQYNSQYKVHCTGTYMCGWCTEANCNYNESMYKQTNSNSQRVTTAREARAVTRHTSHTLWKSRFTARCHSDVNRHTTYLIVIQL